MICFVSLVGRTETEKMDKPLQQVGANGLLCVYCYSDTACGIRVFFQYNCFRIIWFEMVQLYLYLNVIDQSLHCVKKCV